MRATNNSARLVLRIAIAASLAGIVALALWTGCEATNPMQQSNDIVFPATNVSFSQQIQPTFSLNCTYSGCHDDAGKAGGLTLTSYTIMFTDPGVIVPFDTTHSKMCAVLTHRLSHLGGLDTNTNHIRGIAQWVLEGAKDN